MNWSDKTLKILGLSKTEKKVLATITTPLIVRDISGKSGVSRTGVNYCLKKLILGGYVKVQLHNRKKKYVAIDSSELATTLEECSQNLRNSLNLKKGIKVKAADKGEFNIYLGIEEIIPAYEKIALENRDTRVRAIQHHKSWKELVKKMPSQRLVKFNKAIIDNHIIIDGVLNEGAYSDYKREILSDPKLNKSLVESLGERMADYTIFPDKYFDYDAEIWIFKNTTLIINWKHEIATEIHNSDITKFIIDMFDLMKNEGRKINHNQLIRELSKNI